MRLTTPQLVCLVLAALLAGGRRAEGFQADSGSRQSQDDADESKERTFLPLGIVALWRLRPLWKTFSGGFSGYGSFGGSFGGGGNTFYSGQSFYPGQGYYPFGQGVGVGGIAGSGFNQAFFPGGVHPIGYPYPAIGGPGQSQTTVNKRGQRPTALPTQDTIVEDVNRFDDDDASDVDSGTTTSQGLVQSLQEFASPLFHAGQRVEARGASKKRYQFSPSTRRQPRAP